MRRYWIILLAIMAMVGCKKTKTEFTYSPKEPRAGEAVKFSNSSDDAEEWAWTFGDGTTSTSKSPSKIYKRPGTYTVMLKADDKLSRTYTASVTVHDTVPTLMVSDSIVYYHQPVTLKCDAYNPYNHTQTYHWSLPEGTIILSGDTNSVSLKVCFTQKVQAHVSCLFTQNGEEYPLDTTLRIKDTPAQSLLMLQNGSLLRQRLYTYGNENPESILTNLSHLYGANISTHEDLLYVVNCAGAPSVQPGIYKTNLDLPGTMQTVISQGDDDRLYECILYAGHFYWISQNGVIMTMPEAGGTPTQFASASQVGASASVVGCLAAINGHFIWALDSDVNGYLWTFASDLTGGKKLLDANIRSIAVDAIARKLYMNNTQGQLVVCNLDGSNLQVWAEGCSSAICIDNQNNRIYFCKDGVYYLPLAQSNVNRLEAEPVKLNSITNIGSMCMDKTYR